MGQRQPPWLYRALAPDTAHSTSIELLGMILALAMFVMPILQMISLVGVRDAGGGGA